MQSARSDQCRTAVGHKGWCASNARSQRLRALLCQLCLCPYDAGRCVALPADQTLATLHPACVPRILQEPGQKIIDTDTAAQMLALVLPGAPFVEAFCEFLTEQKDYKKSE